jgi:response regulator RpfG family c-di-GMP phosphodiesterase
VDEALELIVDSGGQLFDPAVVQVFSDRFDEILRVRESNL